MKRGFTLIEIIVVIIIVGILAAVGMTQYSKTVEKGRGAEARMNLGLIRKLAFEYYLKNGTVDGIANADVNIGTGGDKIPSACRSSHYFRYGVSTWVSNPTFWAYARRCTSGGKSPQWTGDVNDGVWLGSNFVTGSETWQDIAGNPPMW